MDGDDSLQMVKRRFKEFKDAGLLPKATYHTSRATTITDLLEGGVDRNDVHELAGRADPRTTRLYDRPDQKTTRNVMEMISI